MRRVVTDNPWEKRYRYARAVRAGDVIAVSGTVAADRDGAPVGRDAYEQTAEILRVLEGVLTRAGSGLGDVVRLRVYHAGEDVSEGFSRALEERFPDGAPALTTVRVASLVAPGFLLEIEADAVAGHADVTSKRREDGAPVWEESGD